MKSLIPLLLMLALAYGLDIGGVGIGKFSPKTPAGIAAKVAAIKQQIASGKITNIPTTVK